MKKRLFIILTLLLCVSVSFAGQREKKAKYVFYFIGDGMGFSHLSIAEAYLAHLDGKIGSNALSFTTFPAMGMATTYSSSNNITCSSAAGTALSTGYKTNNGFLGVAPDSTNLESISYKIHRTGKKIGIITTVSVDHATPAAFYANSVSRSDYYPIAKQLGESGFEFFGGGGFINPTGKGEDQPSAYDFVEERGYTIAAGVEQYKSLKNNSKKMLLLQKEGRKSRELPFALERKEGDLRLADILTSAIDYLDNSKGFFIMAEGGKIDWAAHSNNAKEDIMEVLDFSESIAIAYEFYLKHPDETLIVVTADHETGGFAMGRKSGYMVNFDAISAQIKGNEVNAATYDTAKVEMNIEETNKASKLGWTTGGHTGSAVPVFAIGTHCFDFCGRMNNTDIPRKICSAMGIDF